MGCTKTAHAHVQFKIATAAFSVSYAGGVSNAGEESSEEEEEDESVSPSLRGSTSPITAAKHQMSRKKLTTFSERGYLNSLALPSHVELLSSLSITVTCFIDCTWT